MLNVELMFLFFVFVFRKKKSWNHNGVIHRKIVSVCQKVSASLTSFAYKIVFKWKSIRRLSCILIKCNECNNNSTQPCARKGETESRREFLLKYKNDAYVKKSKFSCWNSFIRHGGSTVNGSCSTLHVHVLLLPRNPIVCMNIEALNFWHLNSLRLFMSAFMCIQQFQTRTKSPRISEQ